MNQDKIEYYRAKIFNGYVMTDDMMSKITKALNADLRFETMLSEWSQDA